MQQGQHLLLHFPMSLEQIFGFFAWSVGSGVGGEGSSAGDGAFSSLLCFLVLAGGFGVVLVLWGNLEMRWIVRKVKNTL
jgi:hypothetical protein